MKRLLLFIIVLMSVSSSAVAQSYMNEWIDYNKTYHKFYVGSNGLYRISQAQLASIGIGNADAAHFQLWRQGKEVPLHTSSASGALPANGFIEFWGEANDGEWEKRMYIEERYQINPRISNFTDTATYFLTVNTAGNNLRYTPTINNISSPLPAEPYFIHKTGVNFKNFLSPGFAAVVGSFVYSSSFDEGEGYTSNPFGPATTLTSSLGNLFVASGGPNAWLRFSAAGRNLYPRQVRVSINNTRVRPADTTMNYFNSLKDAIADNIPLSLISGSNVDVQFNNITDSAQDRMVIGMYELNYPRLFNFGNQTSFEFELPASAAGNKLVITNFNAGTQPPVLIDITNRLRIVADNSVAGQFTVVLPPSAGARKLVLLSTDGSVVKTINSFTQRNFINYGLSANQGDYLIISNPKLYNDGSGVNQVEQYRLYRSSTTGGGFNVKIYNVQELLDQFGFGIKNNAMGIKNFLRYTRNVFPVKPSNCLIIGKGVAFNEYRAIESNPLIEQLNLVPSYGYPASDMLLASDEGNVVPKIAIGRLSVINGTEIKDYLDKVKQYESFYNTNSCTISDELWKKNIIHVAGANDFVGDQILFSLNRYKRVVEDTLIGGNVTTLKKSGVATVQTIGGAAITKLFNEGFGMLTYFGHSSPTTLEYNLDNPFVYPATGKYPVFLVNGCAAGNMFISSTNRLTGSKIISENWVLSPQRGSIAFIASTHLGIVNYLEAYSEEFYKQIAKTSYGKSIGHIMGNVVDSLIRINSFDDFYIRMHTEEIALHGDPAIKLYSSEKPDYAIEPSLIRISPEFVSIAETSFKTQIKIVNLARAVNDSVQVLVTRETPDGIKAVLYDRKIRSVRYADSLTLDIPINPFKDKGLNKITVEIDKVNVVNELCETNNAVTKEFFIFEDEIRPVYPYNYSIINKQNITFYGSTANPLGTSRKYYFEIDTTQKFNSSLKKIDSTNSVGGSIAFTPSGIMFRDSVVYYWRLGMRPQVNSAIQWNQSSFVYIPGNITGFNQSHFFQHQQSKYSNIVLDPITRRSVFDSVISSLQVRTGIFPFHTAASIDISLNLANLERYGCRGGTFQFYIFDGKTLKPMENWTTGASGRFNSHPTTCSSPAPAKRLFFEYSYFDRDFRKWAMDFIDSIPNGSFVFVTNLGANAGSIADANTLKNDEAFFGPGKSLYHKFKSVGITMIDSFVSNRPMILSFKKNDASYTNVQLFGETPQQLVNVFEFPSLYISGKIESPLYGPAKLWKRLAWNGSDVEQQFPDSTSIDVFGRSTANGPDVLLATVKQVRDTSLSFINPVTYPYLKLVMNNTDEKNVTPHQLNWWRVYADLVAEGAIAPNITFSFKDTVELGEPIDLAIAFKNVSETAFDSLRVKMIITDRNNDPKQILLPKKKPLSAGDSLVVSYRIDTKNLAGTNTLYLMVNPDNDQPEQLLFNNFIYKGFYVKPDNYQPWLDVTFDGVHILNSDIVSAKPHIVIKLKDDSRFMALNDTSGMKIKIRYPGANGAVVEYKPNSDSVRFTPANLANGENAATIDLFPRFTQDSNGDDYELIVSGTDKSGNKAGDLEYKVSFQVINKAMISNMLNYPNPFTTSTAFVFTITGSEVPQNISIQILTITGKVVREITKNELGNLHIGRNITDFKWDGTDQFGNKLANGIYLYRVITNHNGKSLEKYKERGDKTDQYFNKGYGKMYLMR
jgi:Peptidase family C25